ncbi:MAG: DUF2784 domain-containing protein [Pyrinomonadaceae bacterium]
MVYRFLADAVLIFHLCFVLFAVFGGLLALRWRRIVWFHLPAVVWAFLVQWFRWICPLTPLEIWLRQAGGEAGYDGGFIEHYILKILYIPAGPWFHISLAALVVFLNIFVYVYVFSRRSRKGPEVA